MHSIKPILSLIMVTLLSSGCTAGRTAFSKAQKLENDGNLDAALVKYAEVTTANPEVGEYRVGFLKATDATARMHFKRGETFYAQKNYDEALREYQSAYAIDPTQLQAKQQADLLQKLKNAQLYYMEGIEFEKNRKPREAMVSYKHALEFDNGNKQIKGAMEHLLSTKPAKLDGFETFQQAMEIITGMQKLGKKVLNENTIILYPKSPEKYKQYEDLFLQTFYLNKLDAKKAVNLIRTMLQVKKIYVNEEMNALVIRDTPEVVEVARKILEANDVPDAEVLLEVEVFELSKNNAETFGMALSKYSASLGVTTPTAQGGGFFSDSLGSTTTTSTTGTTTVTPPNVSNLLSLFAFKGYNGYLTVPNATFNFGKTLANGETLSNPKIRVKNREKAKFNVGTRVPITTTSSPSGGGVSVNVQYVDVGVKVNAEPTIQLNNEISIKLGLEVSSILQKDTIGTDQATTVVTIGTRNLDTVLSLKDGETSIIGGLIQKTKTDSKSKVFLLGDIPFLGALFTNTNDATNKTELMLAITPRIVRGVTVPENDVAAFWSGREDEPSANKPYSSFVQEPEMLLAAPGTPAPSAAAPPAAPSAQPVPPASVPVPAAAVPTNAVPSPALPAPSTLAPVTAPPVTSRAAGMPAAGNDALAPAPAVAVPVPVPVQPGAASVPAAAKVAVAPAAPARKAAAGSTPVVLSLVAPVSVNLNDQFSVQVNEFGAKNLYSSVYILSYPKNLQVLTQSEGPFLKQNNVGTRFQAYDDKKKGEVWLSQSRTTGVVGASGDGALAVVTFKAIAKGKGVIGISNPNFTNQAGESFTTNPTSTALEVK